MKRFISFFIAAVMMISVLPTAFAADNIIDLLEYTIENGEVTITKCDRSVSGNVVIPSKIDGYPVTEIDYNAFSYCQNIENITFPESLRKIDAYAFSYCKKLKEVTLPVNLEEIGAGAFTYCDSLVRFKISKNNKNFFADGNGVLFNKDKTELFIFPAGKGEASYVVPESVRTVGIFAFCDCKALESITFNADIEFIEDYVFEHCLKLTSVSYKAPKKITNGDVFIASTAFYDTPYYNSCLDKNGFYVTPEGILLQPENVNEDIYVLNIPATVKYVAADAIRYYKYPNVKKVVLSSNVVIETDGIIDYGQFVTDPNTGDTRNQYNIQEIVFNGDCLLKKDALNCFGLKSVVFNRNVKSIGSICHSKDVVIEHNYRESLKYNIKDNNGKQHGIVSKKGISMSEEYEPKGEYIFNGNFYDNSAVKYFPATDGTMCALYGFENMVQLFRADKKEAVAVMTKKGYKCAAGTIGDDNYLYLLWVKNSSDEEYQKAPDTTNIIVSKYTLAGKSSGECKLPISKTEAIQPLCAGNAAIAYNKGTIGVVWTTLWVKFIDGLNHQGAEFAAIDAKTMKLTAFDSNICSHSFGVVMRPSWYGFEIINNCDASPRGVVLNRYFFGENYTDSNCIFSSPGQYGTNEHHLDGNATYLNLGSLVSSKTTYALAGRGEKIYTSEVYMDSAYRTGNYDVFVRIIDQTLSDIASKDCAGENRIDKSTGKIADTNVIWLTSYDKTERADGVKVVTLASGAYCVLWNEYNNIDDEWVFDGIHYVILDEKGYTLRKETVMYGGELNNTNIMPVVKGNTLSWASYDREENKLNWYTADLDKLYSEHKKEVIKGYAATCIQNGLTDGEKCSVCGKVLTAQKEIAAHGHSEKKLYGYAATCTETGLTDGVGCWYCDDVLAEQKSVKPEGHNFGDWYISRNPSYTSAGEERRHCYVCGYEEVRKIFINGYMAGDADRDGKITAADARIALRCSVMLEDFSSDSYEYKACDVDKDGSVTASDARSILRASVGLEKESDWA